MDYPVEERMLPLARRWLATPPGRRRPASARPAATIVLVRDGADGLECYLQWRPETMRFAAGVAVFPGGAVEPHDEDLAVTGLRELFEETGVLLADPADSAAPPPGPLQLASARDRVEAGEPLTPVAARLGVRLRPDLLIWWMRHITPEFMPHRYDTTFFVTTARPLDDPRPLTGETVSGAWVSCARALADGTPLMQPTREVLTELAGACSAADLAGTARDRTPVMSYLVEDGGPLRLRNGLVVQA